MSEGTAAEAEDLLGTGTWTRQGPATLVLREGAWAVLVPGLRKQVIEAAWTVLGEQPAPEEFLDRLVEAGRLGSADKLTALLFGFHDGTSATLGVKGSTPIAAYTARGSQRIAGTDEEPFVLRALEGVRRVAFGDLPVEDGIGAPRLGSGIVPVRGFVHVTVDPADLGEAERAALAAQVEADGRSIEDPAAKQRRAARPAPSPTTAPPRLKPALATRRPGEMPPSLERGGPRASSSTTGASGQAPEPAGPNLFAGLFTDSSTPAAASAAGAGAPAAPSPPASPAPAAPPAPTADATPAPGAPSAATDDAPAPTAPSDDAAAASPSGSAPSAASGAEPPAPGEDEPRPAVGSNRRRLVSTSLFDRRRRSPGNAPSTAPERAQAPAPGAAPPAGPPASGAARPGTPAQPLGPRTPAETTVGPSEQPTPAVSPAPSAAIATPAPPEDDDLLSPVTQVAPIDDDLESPVTQVAPIDDEERHHPPAAAPRRASAPRRSEPSVAAGGDLENTGAYDDLFGKTVFRRIEDAAVRRSEDEDAAGDRTESATTAPAQRDEEDAPRPDRSSPVPSAAPTGPAPADPAPPSAASEFIDWVPGVGRTAPEIAQTAARRASAPPPPAPAYPQVHMAARPSAPHPGPPPAAPPAPQQPAGPSRPAGWPDRTPAGGGLPPRPGAPVTLPGQLCAHGHANSPERSRCRTCGAALQGRTRPVARPPLGTVTISSGESFVLDRTAIIGRRPRASRVSAHDVPQLITVPSPQQDISRSHLELRLEGWHVVAIDLGTTNGTTLHRHGFEPVRLRPREGMVLHDGDHLDLGDGVHLAFGERA